MSSSKKDTSKAKTTDNPADSQNRSNTPEGHDVSTSANPPSHSRSQSQLDQSQPQICFLDHQLSKIEDQWETMVAAIEDLLAHIANLNVQADLGNRATPTPSKPKPNEEGNPKYTFHMKNFLKDLMALH
jgi:hypothetical protein